MATKQTPSDKPTTDTTMTDNTTPPRESSNSTEQQSSPTTPLTQRLEPARLRIRAACAEYNFFNPTYYTGHPLSSHPTLKHPPPEPEQVKRDLQMLHDRVLALKSSEADAIYEEISTELRGMANDEYSGFDWKWFQGAVGKGLRRMEGLGFLIEVRDLGTLRMVGAYL